MTASPIAPLNRPDLEWITRPLFGVFMAAIAVSVLFYDPVWFACAGVLVGLFGAREWHRMVRVPVGADAGDIQPGAIRAGHTAIHVQTALTAFSVACAAALLLGALPLAAIAMLLAGSVVSFVLAARHADNPLWHAAGTLYLGLPVLALVALRASEPQGLQIVLGLFLIVWATDTGALVFGKLIGGARIVPRLSPGKTWAGTIGGCLSAAAVYGLYLGVLGFHVLAGMAFALLFSLVAHSGDLLESAIKRHFGKKDSGTMIPGHGGILDRMDSIFLASVVLALLVFGARFNPLFGGHA
jgi:phosphatidate cytidylyltransferase